MTMYADEQSCMKQLDTVALRVQIEIGSVEIFFLGFNWKRNPLNNDERTGIVDKRMIN